MLTRVKQYINKQDLFGFNDKILVALSGGADSVALLYILKKLGYKVYAAHCNFKLRGAESDEDEAFVRKLVHDWQVEAHFTVFDTQAYAKAQGVSIEMAARDLRYQWFYELSRQHAYSRIAVGHHLNDSIETLLLNLSRGTGIKGITGISAKNQNVVRPLLCVNRDEIETMLNQENLSYRHDSSNDSLHHMRNIIRHQVIPAFKAINPAFEQVMVQNLLNFQDAASIYEKQLGLLKEQLVRQTDNRLVINAKKLLDLPYKTTVLFDLLSPMGFSFDSISKALNAMESEPGRIFFSESHQLLVDRMQLIVEPVDTLNEVFVIDDLNGLNSLPFLLQGNMMSVDEFVMKKNAKTGSFDAEKLEFPLTFRHWNSGDRFYPLGMKQQKKLSDFFTDQKIDRFTKDKVWIMESNQQIAWLVGLRIDDRFKVTGKTREVLVLKLK
ncbi:MAG: tRNA lysidine(34) synthetase TilS [Salinivirgaceae bacterium]